MSVITIERKVLEKNGAIAAQNRELFGRHRLFVVNVLSSPVSGKTSLLERTIERLGSKQRIAVIEGDVQTDFDAQRVARHPVPVIQIVTNGGCHLEAKLVKDALTNFDLKSVDLLIIENVGNLLCPANYDLGEAMKVILISTTEGADKPLKYPWMFRNASILIINKTDLLPYVNCRIEQLKQNALPINPSLTIFETSCTSGAGIPEWYAWLEKQTISSQ